MSSLQPDQPGDRCQKLNVVLDRTHISLLSKMLDTLRAFVPECHFNSNLKGVSLTNLDDTHTVAVMGLLAKDFFTHYAYGRKSSDGVIDRDNDVIEESNGEGEIFSINLEQLYKILKSSTRTTSANLNICPTKIEVSLVGADQRRKSHFSLDTYQNSDNWDDLSKDIQTNIDEYPYQIEIRSADFREILSSIKIFKTELVTLILENDLLTFTHGEHRIDYTLLPDGTDEILEEGEVSSSMAKSVSVQLGTDRLLYLARALSISSFTKICLSSEYHPVYFCFHIEDDPNNQLVIALSPRDG